MKKNKLFFLMGCAVLMFFSVSVFSEPTRDDLMKIERQLQAERKVQLESQRKSDKLADEIRSVQRQMVRSAKAVQEKEDHLLHLDRKLEELREEEASLLEKLSKSKARTVHLVTALQSLALRPREQIFLEKQAPSHILRSRLMLNSSVPIARRMTQEVLADMEKLEATKIEIQAQISRVRETMEKLNERTEKMNGLISRKLRLQAQYDASHQKSGKKIVALANQANDLKELLQKIEQERQRRLEEERLRKEREMAQKQEREEVRPTLNPFSSNKGISFVNLKGKLSFPVVGRVVENFGESTVKGMHSKGLTIQTRPGTTLRSPIGGAVLFAGPFKSYGKMLIIDCKDGYLLLLAGLDEINVSAGQDVIEGEPVGRMGVERLNLYIEIRKDGQAIDPMPWFQR